MNSILKIQRRKQSAFTLIELLVVIAIIGILAGLILAGTQGAMDAAKRAETLSLLTGLKNAIVAYETEYGILPDVSSADMFLSNTTSGEDLVKILTANPATAAVVTQKNPRQIRFIEIAKKHFENSDPNTYRIVDSWKQSIRIGISKNYNTVDMGSGFTNQPLNVTVALASPGKDNTFSDAKAIKTW